MSGFTVAEYHGWFYRPPAPMESGQCRASWEQDGWSFWCHLPVGHAGPHQEAGESDDRRYLVLWDDGPGDSDGARAAGA